MNKSELIELIGEKANIQKMQAEDFMNLVFDMLKMSLMDGKRIEIRGFGSFVARSYKPYRGRNPRTCETIEVRPKRLPYFKVGKELKERVDRKPS